MAWLIIIGTLAAFGFWCCIFCVLGWFLSEDRKSFLICLLPEGHPADGAIARYRWLKELGLVCGPLLIIRSQAEEPLPPDIEYCSPQELPARLELERKKLD